LILILLLSNLSSAKSDLFR